MSVISMIQPSAGSYSETFIKRIKENLDLEIHFLTGGIYPRENSSGLPYFGWLRKKLYGTVGRILGTDRERFLEQLFISLPREKRDRLLIKEWMRNNVSVVYAHFGLTGVSVLQAVKKTELPLIVHFHGQDAYKEKILSTTGKSYPELFEYASRIVVVSEDMKEQLLELGAPAEKLRYIRYGVDLDQFQPTKPSDNPKRLLSVGRFVDKKAPHLLLDAFELTLKEIPEAILQLLGDGPLLGACKQIVKSRSLEDSVEFHGVVDHNEVARLMGQARAFVQHSVTAPNGDKEGTPNTILEASASGLPVVSTYHAGIPEAVVDGETGLLCDEYDVEAMAANMVEILSDPEKSDQMGSGAREQIEKLYSSERYINEIDSLINEVLEGGEEVG